MGHLANTVQLEMFELTTVIGAGGYTVYSDTVLIHRSRRDAHVFGTGRGSNYNDSFKHTLKGRNLLGMLSHLRSVYKVFEQSRECDQLKLQ